MNEPSDRELDTTGGKIPLFQYCLRRDGREWTVLHAGAVLTTTDESQAISSTTNRLPYGASLWPAAIALAHEIASRPADFQARSVLELGAGLGLPGIVAASLGAHVVQTDRDELALHICERNGQRNGAHAIEHRLADWTDWSEPGHFDWIIGSDILYGESLHPHLRRIFGSNLAPGGRMLLADPFRGAGFRFLETLESEGWNVTFAQWDVGQEGRSRPMGVFELKPPALEVPDRAAKEGPCRS
jgi:predicted nicotinamide N-methyase